MVANRAIVELTGRGVTEMNSGNVGLTGRERLQGREARPLQPCDLNTAGAPKGLGNHRDCRVAPGHRQRRLRRPVGEGRDVDSLARMPENGSVGNPADHIAFADGVSEQFASDSIQPDPPPERVPGTDPPRGNRRRGNIRQLEEALDSTAQRPREAQRNLGRRHRRARLDRRVTLARNPCLPRDLFLRPPARASLDQQRVCHGFHFTTLTHLPSGRQSRLRRRHVHLPAIHPRSGRSGVLMRSQRAVAHGPSN